MDLQTLPSPDCERSPEQRRSRRRAVRWLIAGVLLVASTALVACGGDAAGPGASPTVASGSTTAAPTTAPPVTTPGDPAGSPPTTTQQTTPSATTTVPGQTGRRARADRRRSTGGQAPAAQPEPEASSAPQAAKPAPKPEPAPAKPAGTPIEELAILTLVERTSPRHYVQQGTVTGTFDGTMAVEATITNRGVLVVFTATVDGGTISGRSLTRPIITGSPMADIQGTAKITGGTGRFASISGRGLAVTGRAALDGSRARIRLAGVVTY